MKDSKTFKTFPVGDIDKDTNSMTWRVKYLADLETLVKALRSLKMSFEDLLKQETFSEDKMLQQYYNMASNLYREVRKYVKNTYPEDFLKISKTLYLKEHIQNIIKEISLSGDVGSYQTKMIRKKGKVNSGYKTVDKKKVRSKSKGVKYVDLWNNE